MSSLFEEWTSRWAQERPTRKSLQQKVDHVIFAYEENEAQEQKTRQTAKNIHGQVIDSDGFIVVQSKKRKSNTLEESKSKRDKTKVSSSSSSHDSHQTTNKDFYRFQAREAKLSALQELKKAFEKDKERIAKMKENRKFKTI